MIFLHFRIKMRAFGITCGTLEDRRDVTGPLLNVVGMAMKALKIPVPMPLQGLVGEMRIDAKTLYDDRGVFIELTSEK